MSKRKTLIGLVVVLVAVLVVVWKSSTGTHEPVRVFQPDVEASTGIAEDTSLPPLEAASGASAREELAQDAELATDSANLEPTATKPDKATRSFWCRLRSADDGAPVADAQLAPLTKGSFDPVTADGTGLGELLLDADLSPAVRVESEGFGTVVFKADLEHTTPGEALEILLSRSGQLTVRVEDSTRFPLADVEIRIETPSYAVTRPEGQSMFGGQVHWKAKTNADGLSTFANLPAGAPLSARATKDGKVLYTSPTDVILQPGESRELTWAIGAGAVVHGWLRDQHGAPVSRKEMWLTQNASNSRLERERFYFHSNDRREAAKKVRTNAQGEFRFEDVAAGRWYIGPEAYDSYDRAPKDDDVAPLATVIDVVVGASSSALELRVHRGLFIRGRVELPSGDPPKDLNVFSHSEYGSMQGHVQDFEFQVGPLEPVAHSIRVRGRGNFLDARESDVFPGTEELVLRLGNGGVIEGSFIDAGTGEACPAAVTISCDEPKFLAMGILGLKLDSEFKREGLEPGFYNVAGRTTDGRAGYLTGVEVERGGHVKDCVVRLVPGSKLRIHYTGPSEYIQYHMRVQGVIVAANGLQSGTSELEVVPAGEVTVEVFYGIEPVTSRVVHCEVGQIHDVKFDLE